MPVVQDNGKPTSNPKRRPNAEEPHSAPDIALSPGVAPPPADIGAAAPSRTPTAAPRATDRPEARGAARFWGGVCVAAALSLPFGWILSYAAALPFFVGAFFFALLGLVIGATAFRIAKSAAPYRRAVVVAGTTIIVLTGFLTTLTKEGRDFPGDAARIVADRTQDLGDRSLAEFQAVVAAEVSVYLSTRYAPGGTLGYVRWVLDNGEIRKGELSVAQQTIRAPQKGWVWIVRVALSAGLLAFGVGSQTLLLAAGSNRTKTASRETVLRVT